MMASRQVLVLLIAAVLCNNVMGRPSKMKDDCSFSRQKPSVGILRIRYFLFGDDFLSQEELELSDLEPTAGQDKIGPSGTKEQMRPTDQKGQPNPMRLGDQKQNQPMAKPPVPIPRQPEGQTNPQNQEKLPVNPPMVDPSKTGAPLPDESVNQLEQQKMKDPETENPNPSAFPTGQSSQKKELISEDMGRNQEPLEQLNAQKNLQQQFQQPQQQFQQPQQRQPLQQTQQQPFQPQQRQQEFPTQKQQFQPELPQQDFQSQKQMSQPQQLEQQLQQDQPQQQPQEEFQPQEQQQQPRAMERRKRSQPIRQFPSDYEDSYPRYWPDLVYPNAGEIFRERYLDDPTAFQRPMNNMGLRMQDDRSGYQRPRYDSGVDIDLNV